MSKTVRAADVAAYILEKTKGVIEQMRLHKLLFYCQAGSLVWDGVPLFHDRIEAWVQGPVIVNIWNSHRYEFMIDSVAGSAAMLDNDNRETIDTILSSFGDMSASELSSQTHREKPWQQARANVLPGARSRNKIRQIDMKHFYATEWAP